MLTIILSGNPATKKNSQQIICRGNRPMLIQSKTYRDYRKSALKQLMAWGNIQYTGPIELTCLYYCKDDRKRDLTNLLAATQDILEDAGIILDDSQVVSVDGSRIKSKDKLNPRAEISIRATSGGPSQPQQHSGKIFFWGIENESQKR